MKKIFKIILFLLIMLLAVTSVKINASTPLRDIKVYTKEEINNMTSEEHLALWYENIDQNCERYLEVKPIYLYNKAFSKPIFTKVLICSSIGIVLVAAALVTVIIIFKKRKKK